MTARENVLNWTVTEVQRVDGSYDLGGMSEGGGDEEGEDSDEDEEAEGGEEDGEEGWEGVGGPGADGAEEEAGAL